MTIETWKFINSFAPWLSAIGSISAVITALYFSYSNRKILLKISADIFEFSENEKFEEYVCIQILNTGFKSTLLHSFGWQTGIFRKRIIMTGRNNIDHNKSSIFSCKLAEGEMAQIAIKINQEKHKNYLQMFFNDFLRKSPKMNLYSLKVVAYPSIGPPFKSKIGKTLRDKYKQIIG